MNLNDLKNIVAQAEYWASQNNIDPSEMPVRMGTQVDTWPPQFDVQDAIAHDGALHLIQGDHPQDSSPYMSDAVLEDGEVMWGYFG